MRGMAKKKKKCKQTELLSERKVTEKKILFMKPN